MNNQKKTPIVDALNKYRKKRIVSFDVPGHKQGKSTKVLANILGEKCVHIDYNSSKPLDNATHPIGIIKEAQQSKMTQCEYKARIRKTKNRKLN